MLSNRTVHKWKRKLGVPIYAKCQCRKILDIKSIRYHLYKDGFKPDYWVWIEHGKVLALENQFSIGYIGSSFSGVHFDNEEGGNVT